MISFQHWPIDLFKIRLTSRLFRKSDPKTSLPKLHLVQMTNAPSSFHRISPVTIPIFPCTARMHSLKKTLSARVPAPNPKSGPFARDSLSWCMERKRAWWRWTKPSTAWTSSSSRFCFTLHCLDPTYLLDSSSCCDVTSMTRDLLHRGCPFKPVVDNCCPIRQKNDKTLYALWVFRYSWMQFQWCFFFFLGLTVEQFLTDKFLLSSELKLVSGHSLLAGGDDGVTCAEIFSDFSERLLDTPLSSLHYISLS